MNYDGILIPGGGLLPDGGLPPWTTARLDHALQHHKETRWVVCLSGGTVHKPPPLDENGYPVFESRAAANYLIEHGCDPDRLLTEISSYDTIGNAYFSRLLFAEPLNLRSLLVITSGFHLLRTKKIFRWVYSLPPEAPPFELSFAATPDSGLSPEALQSRMEREQNSLKALQHTRQRIREMEVLHRWIYREHAAYAASLEPDRVEGETLASY